MMLLTCLLLASAAALPRPALRAGASAEEDPPRRRKLSVSTAETKDPGIRAAYQKFEAKVDASRLKFKTPPAALKVLVPLWRDLGRRAPEAAQELGIPELANFRIGAFDRSAAGGAINRAVRSFTVEWAKSTDSRALLETAVSLGLEVVDASAEVSRAARTLNFGAAGTCQSPDYRAMQEQLTSELPHWQMEEPIPDSTRYICSCNLAGLYLSGSEPSYNNSCGGDPFPEIPYCCFSGELCDEGENPDSTCAELLNQYRDDLTYGGKTAAPSTFGNFPEEADEFLAFLYGWAPGPEGDACCDDSDCCDIVDFVFCEDEESDGCEQIELTPTQCVGGQCVNTQCAGHALPLCHPAASKLLLADGSSAPISEVELGALVASPSGPKRLVAFLHSDHEAVGEYVRLTTTTGAAIEISPLHLLPVNGELTDPADVVLGDVLQTPRGPEAIVRVEKIQAAGAFHVVVEGGLYYVDGVLASDHHDKFPLSVWPLVRGYYAVRYQLGIPIVPLEKGRFSLEWPFQLLTSLGVPASVQRNVLFPITLPLAFFTGLANTLHANVIEPAAAPSWAGNHSTSAYKHALFAGVGADVSRAGL